MIKRVSIIDGNNFFHRTFWMNCDVKDFTKSLGGIVKNILIMRQNSLKNQRVIMAFDTCKSERRLNIYPDYKAGRVSSLTPEQYAMFQQVFPAFIDICRSSDMSVLDGNGYEADDYIALLSYMLRTNYFVKIISTDGDFPQLIDERISVYNPNLKMEITPLNFENIFGFKRQFYLDYKCLIGDKSDNIPKIQGLGKETAANYILEYGNYESIVEELKKKNAGKKKPSVVETRVIDSGELIKKNKELMDLSVVKSDSALRLLVKEKIQSKKYNRIDFFNKLLEYDLGEYFKQFEKCMI